MTTYLASDGSQPGDSAKAARTILTALDAPNPPLRLVLGGDAVDSILERLQAAETEVRQWEPASRDTAHKSD